MSRIRPLLLAMLACAALAPSLSPAAVAADSKSVAAMPAANRAPAAAEPQLPKLSAAQIVDRHVLARGGLQAWKSVQALQFTGKLEAGRGDNIARAEKIVNATRKASGKANAAQLVAANADVDADKQIQLPFTLDLKRPNRMRLEVGFDGKTAVQVFDGEHGWKYRPFLNRSDAEPYSPDETKAEGNRGDLDGPLINYAAKGSTVELEGTDLVDAQPAYRLKVTLRNGTAQHVWIDAKTFLDVKVEGTPRRMDGKLRPVYVYQRDFRQVQGVMIPFELDSAVDGYPDRHRVLIEKGTVNPGFEDSVFAKPGV